MASQKQIEANRRNAEKSTGPKSPKKPKAKTRLNAMRDGFTGQITTLSDEDRPIFENFKSDFIKDLAPKTMMELSLASAIAWDTWRLNHLRAVEMNIYALGASNTSVEIEADNPGNPHRPLRRRHLSWTRRKRFALMSIYEQRMNRSIHKNLATLRQLQAERKANYQRDLEEEIILARANDINNLPYQTSAAPSQNGSVFSNREVFTAAHRVTVLQAAKTTLYQTPFKVQFAGASSAAPAETSADPSNLRNWPEPDAA